MRTKDLFLMMQEQEVQTNNFLPTKKEIEVSAKKFAENILDKGEHNLYELISQTERLEKSLSVIKDVIKNALPREKHSAFGIEIVPRAGREMINYKECELWVKLNKKIKDREELLKLAIKSDDAIYDAEGVEVPICSVSYAKDSLEIKY